MSQHNSDQNPVPCPDCGHVHGPDEAHEPHPPGAAQCLHEISEHVSTHLGEIVRVFHEKESTLAHIDVLMIAPTEASPCIRLVTSGMSDLPMAIPAKYADEGIPRHAELMITLPADWKMEMRDFDDERWYWPLRLLKRLALYPHLQGTYLAAGHTVPNGGEPFADCTALDCALITDPPGQKESFYRLRIDEDKEIAFYAVVPLYPEETEYKLARGADALLRLFEHHQLGDLVENERPNVALDVPEDFEDGDPDLVECAVHGESRVAYVCRHLVEDVPGPLGFIEPGREGEDEEADAQAAGKDGVEGSDEGGGEGDEEEDDGLEAWCDACDEVLEREGEWTDAAMEFADIQIVCEHCFATLRERHAKPA